MTDPTPATPEEELARLAPEEVSAAAGVPLEVARTFWRALGIPTGTHHAPAFTQDDAAALRRMAGLVRDGTIDESLALSMTRAIARTTDRLVAWQSSLVLDAVLHADGAPDEPVDDVREVVTRPLGSGATGGTADSDVSHRAGDWLHGLVDDLEPLVVYSWRRHMDAALRRLFAEGRSEDGAPTRTVGFADMVGFTALVTRLSDAQLGRLVDRFDAVTHAVVTAHGGTVVKTVGDEVLFTAEHVDDGVAIALELVDALADDPSLPPLRAGLAWGEVLDHQGDVFGTTVNRASRITEIATPSTVVVDEHVARALSGRGDYSVDALDPTSLRGLGVTGMWTIACRRPVTGGDLSA